jgi:hypothetical protein
MQDDSEFKQLARTAVDPDYVMMSPADTGHMIANLMDRRTRPSN